MTPLLLFSLLSAFPAKGELERAVRDRFESSGRTAPPVDPRLSGAADELAQRALTHGVEDASSLLRVTAALSRQRGWDPNPVVVALRAPTESLLTELSKQELANEPTTHWGLGLAVGAERSALILLLARRRVELAPFPRTYPKPIAGQRLCGMLADGLEAAEIFGTRPNGAVERIPMPVAGKRRCASISFGTIGRHAVEVLASGPRGPEVAALFFVDVGPVGDEAEDALPEPQDTATSRAMLLSRINALRLQMGLVAVQLDPELDAVAQGWAQRLADENFFSHVDPEGGTLKQRLMNSGYKFSAAGENLGLSAGPLAAHFGIEHSPAHRNNLLEPAHRRLGLGLSRRADGLQVLVEVLAQPIEPMEEKDPLESVYESIAAERQRRKLPPLVRHPILEGLAQSHAREALALEIAKASLPGRPGLHERAFELVDNLSTVSVDVFVSVIPRLDGEWKNLSNASNQIVAVGLTRGHSERFGPDRYWIVVICGVLHE